WRPAPRGPGWQARSTTPSPGSTRARTGPGGRSRARRGRHRWRLAPARSGSRAPTGQRWPDCRRAASAAAGAAFGRRAHARPDVLVEPSVERRGGPPGVGDVIERSVAPDAGLRREASAGDQRRAAEQLDTRMVTRVAARCGAKALPLHLEPGLARRGGRVEERRAGPIARRGGAEA